MISAVRICPKCGAEIPADAPEGGCPGCLLESGLRLLDEEAFGDLALTEMKLGESALAMTLAARGLSANPIEKDAVTGPRSLEVRPSDCRNGRSRSLHRRLKEVTFNSARGAVSCTHPAHTSATQTRSDV